MSCSRTIDVLRNPLVTNNNNDAEIHRQHRADMLQRTELDITYAPVARRFEEAIRMEQLILNLLQSAVQQAVPWYQRFLDLANRVINCRAFAIAFNFEPVLPRGTLASRGNPCEQPHWQRTLYLQDFMYLSRKEWSHRGYAVCEGLSKGNDSTNTVYYIAFQGLFVTPLLAQCGALSIACQVTPLLA